jgi:deoxyribonuclease V
VIAVLDAAYSEKASAVACVMIEAWKSSRPLDEFALRRGAQKAYAPGEFYRRELPLLLAGLGKIADQPAVVVIDGYVWLDARGRRGLGACLFEELGQASAVVGVAKTRLAGAEGFAECVMRGKGSSPLYVTAAGMEADEAATHIREMHGEHRLPTHLAMADRLARNALSRL